MPTFPIREAIAATPRAHIIRLDLHGQAFPYLAGQAAYLQPQGADKRRPYSIASAPEQTAQDGLIEFLVRDGGRRIVRADAGPHPPGHACLDRRTGGIVHVPGASARAPVRVHCRRHRDRAAALDALAHAARRTRRTRVADLQRARTGGVRVHGRISAARRRRPDRLPAHGHAGRGRGVGWPSGTHRRRRVWMA